MAMLMLEAVSNDGGVLVEVFVGVEKVRETWGSGMIIGEIFCFLPILFLPFSFFSLCGGVGRNSMNQAKVDAKVGILCHGNNNYLKYLRGDTPRPFVGSVG